MIREPAPDPVLAAACARCPGHCCKSEAVALQASDAPFDRYETEPLVNPLTGEPGLMLAHKPGGDCIYLEVEGGVGRCGIYERRPLICRVYDCGKHYAKTPRALRRQMIRAGGISGVLFEQGRRVQVARGEAG